MLHMLMVGPIQDYLINLNYGVRMLKWSIHLKIEGADEIFEMHFIILLQAVSRRRWDIHIAIFMGLKMKLNDKWKVKKRKSCYHDTICISQK